MFQNYLDYTNDACMNVFTQGQVSRMDVVIGNSPRRASLTTSHGLNDPAPLANDLGVKDIIRPSIGECSAPFMPVAEVRNYGSNAITSARIRLRKDGTVVETKDFTFSPALAPLASQQLSFTSTAFSSGTHNASVEILLTNGVADGQPGNNTLSRTFDVPPAITLPFLEVFDVLPASWRIVNPDQHITWQLASTGTSGNHAITLPFYDYEDHVGEIDGFVSPSFDLSASPAALLKFDVAYAQFNSSSDGLKVVLLSNCNSSLNDGIVVYNKSGSALSTASSTSDAFSPSSTQWRTETVDLTAFIGQANLQIAFVGVNDWGNNLYVDNIGLTTTPIADVVAVDISQPSPVTCADQIAPTVTVFNAGTQLTALTFTVTVNGVTHTENFHALNMPGNTSFDFALQSVSLVEGENDIRVVLSDPNGTTDFYPFNNEIEKVVIRNTSTDEIPLRQKFDNSTIGNWTTVNPRSGMNWAPTTVQDNPALYVNAFANTTEGDQSWFVSPVLDFTNVPDGQLQYDHSYASRTGRSDRLYILASRDCGNTITDTLYQAGSVKLAAGRSSLSSWVPSSDADWTSNAISLAALAGESEVRIAFVFVNGQGNNIYLDNIEFFVSPDPIRITAEMEIYPTLLSNEPLNATFNLPEKDDVRVDLIDVTGKVLNTYTLQGVLNQTYSFNLYYHVGMYYLRASTRSKVYVERFVIH